MAKHEDELYELLSKEGAGEIENNEDQTTSGENNTYSDAPDKTSVGDPKWSDTGPPATEPATNTLSKQLHRDTREGVLNRSFSGFGQASRAAQSDIKANFDLDGSGGLATPGYEAHSAMLERRVKVAHPRSETLREQVERVAGRR